MEFDNIYTEKYLDNLIKATYEIAPAVYFRYTWKDNWGMTLDDYRQEAVMEIHKLFKNRFITPPKPNYTNTNLKTYVYSILNKFFTINLINTLSRDELLRNTIYIEAIAAKQTDTEKHQNVTDVLMTKQKESTKDYLEETPENTYKVIAGKEILESLLEKTFKHNKYNTRTYEYKDSLGKHMSELNLAKRIIMGYTQADMIKEYTKAEELNKSQEIFIRNEYRKIEAKIREELSKLNTNDKKLVIRYLESI